MLERARQDLLLEGDWDELTLGVFYGLVARHREASVRNGLILSIQNRSEGINLQLQRDAERRRLSIFPAGRRPLKRVLERKELLSWRALSGSQCVV